MTTKTAIFNPQQGFTLIEVLIALFIFALLGTMAAIAFHSILKVHVAVAKRNKQIQKIELLTIMMQRDFSEIIDRSIINRDGHRLAPLLSLRPEEIEFTRAGLVNPESLEKRSQLARVGYLLKDNKLIRLTWTALDQPPDSKPLQRVLLNHVNDMQIEYIDDKGRRHETWPQAVSGADMSNQPSQLPIAIIMTLRLHGMGQLQMIYPIRGRGFANAK